MRVPVRPPSTHVAAAEIGRRIALVLRQHGVDVTQPRG